MTANEWSDQAKQLVASALAITSGKDNAAILALQKKMLQHKNGKVMGVSAAVSTAYNEAMDALFRAIVNNVVAQWASLQEDLESCTVAIEGTAGEAAKAAKLISLQPVTGIAKELTALVSEVKDLKANPQSADAVAQKLEGIQTHLANILKEASMNA